MQVECKEGRNNSSSKGLKTPQQVLKSFMSNFRLALKRCLGLKDLVIGGLMCE